MDDFAPDNLLAPDEAQKNPLATFFVELFKVLLIVAVAVVVIRQFLFKPFVVKGASMEPNFHEKEYLIIDELSYRFKEPARGEIVVVRYSGDQREFFLKRIIGLPGERVAAVAGRVKIYNQAHPDGFYLDESYYLSPSVLTFSNGDVTLQNNEYFVMGDNRTASLDSRRIGPVLRNDLVGRVFLRGWPPNRLDFLIKNYYEKGK